MHFSAAVHVEITALIAGDVSEINRDDGSLWRGKAGRVWPCVLA